MTEFQFEVDVTEADALKFAELSGDWNPLHTDQSYAEGTAFRRRILHGAFSAGLLSRMAGMHIPGEACLLHGMKLRFIDPIFPPARLRVRGQLSKAWASGGQVEVVVSDASSAARYVEGSYEFGYHKKTAAASEAEALTAASSASVLVTGASGGLGSALLRRLGDRGRGVSRQRGTEAAFPGVDELRQMCGNGPIDAIVHCGWPKPDNQRLCALGPDTARAVQHHVAEPLEQAISLAQLLSTNGTPGSTLVLVGSAFADPGRHAYRMPLYSLAKSTIPTLTRILAVELAAKEIKCVGLSFDVMEGPGMNAGINEATRLKHADRSPFGTLATAEDAAAQIEWVLSNRSSLISGATISLTGGAIP